MSILSDTRRKLAEMIHPMGGGISTLLLPRTRYDYQSNVKGSQQAIVMACVGWVQRTYPESPLYIRTRNTDGSWDDIYDHAMLELLDTPNPFYDGLLLQKATLADYNIDGNAYWLKVRSLANRVVQLWWCPSSMIEPKWDHRSDAYITHYDYMPGGTPIPIPPENVVHFRDGLDPINTRKGLSRLKSLFREMFTDDEAANMTASLLKNMGVPGVLVSPKNDEITMTEDEAKVVKEKYKEQFSGDNRGDPMVMSSPTEVTAFGFSPKDMDLRALRKVPEERITGVLGVPAIVAGMGAGLDRSTFANMAEAREMGYENNIVPTQRVFGAVIKRQLLRDFVGDVKGWDVTYDLSEVRVLQEDQNKKATRINSMVEAGIMAVDDAQSEMNIPVDESQHVYLRRLMTKPVPAGVDPTESEADNSADQGNQPAPQDDDESVADDGAKTASSSITITGFSGEVDFQESIPLPVGTKATEEELDVFWKAQEAQRTEWEDASAPQIEELYKQEMAAVIRALKRAGSSDEWTKRTGDAVLAQETKWNDELTSISAAIMEHFMEQAENLISPKSATKQLDETDYLWITDHIATNVRTILEHNKNDLLDVVVKGVNEGQSVDKMTKSIRTFYADNSKWKALRIARTETIAASAEGALQGYRKVGVTMVRFLASPGQCEECALYNGKHYTTEESHGFIPVHPNCRCTWVPVVER